MFGRVIEGMNVVYKMEVSSLALFISLFVSFFLSAFAFIYISYVYGSFSTPFYHIFWVGLPTYFSNHSPFLMKHISFVGLKEFPSFVCWCTVIYHHQPQEPCSKSLTQGDCSRINVGSGNRTFAQVQATDHKSNSLTLGYCAWLFVPKSKSKVNKVVHVAWTLYNTTLGSKNIVVGLCGLRRQLGLYRLDRQVISGC